MKLLIVMKKELNFSDLRLFTDRDECLLNEHNCKSPSDCENRHGSFACSACNSGYTPVKGKPCAGTVKFEID